MEISSDSQHEPTETTDYVTKLDISSESAGSEEIDSVAETKIDNKLFHPNGDRKIALLPPRPVSGKVSSPYQSSLHNGKV